MTENEQKDSWRTPPALFKPLRRKYRFRYDMAASDANHLLPRYFTAEHSALDVDWSELKGWKWCNNKCQQLIIFGEAPPLGSAQIEIMSEGELLEYLSR